MAAFAEGDGAVIGQRLRQWFRPPPETRSVNVDHIIQLVTAQLATAFRELGSVRSSAVYQASVSNLISDAAATAELTGEHSEVLQPRLGAIARQMVDTGPGRLRACHRGGRRGSNCCPSRLRMSPGRSDEDSWFYTVHAVKVRCLYHDRDPRAGGHSQFSGSALDNRSALARPGNTAISVNPATTAKLLSKMEIQLTSRRLR